MTNIAFLTEGGKNIGFGHISRCGSLYNAFQKQGHETLFVVNGDESVQDLLIDKQYRLLNWISDPESCWNLFKENNIEIAVVDSYLAPVSFFETIAEKVALPVFLDDNKRLEYPSGIVLNWSIYAESLNYPANEKITYLLGTHYLSLREAFTDIPEKVIHDTVMSVMITMGGDDSKNVTPKILKMLTRNYPYLEKYIIIGKAYENSDEIKFFADNRTNLIYYPGAEGMKEIMLKCDLAITSGGQTVYEMARVGLPAVAVATGDNQLNNVQTWDKLGFLKYAGSWEDPHLVFSVHQKMEELKSRESRLLCSQVGKSKVTGHGEQNVVSRVLNLLESK